MSKMFLLFETNLDFGPQNHWWFTYYRDRFPQLSAAVSTYFVNEGTWSWINNEVTSHFLCSTDTETQVLQFEVSRDCCDFSPYCRCNKQHVTVRMADKANDKWYNILYVLMCGQSNKWLQQSDSLVKVGNIYIFVKAS